MSWLLRVVLPDIPGALGAVATALGGAGADIQSVDVIEHRDDGMAVDDFVVELRSGQLPDSLVSACHQVEAVRVEFVGRYAAGADLHRDLEAVEEMTAHPFRAEQHLVDMLPGVFPASWGLLIELVDGKAMIRRSSGGAPVTDGFFSPWLPLAGAAHIEVDPGWAPQSWLDALVAAAPLEDGNRVVVLGRDGGPEILDSEVARLAHLAALAVTIKNAARRARETD